LVNITNLIDVVLSRYDDSNNSSETFNKN